MLLHRLTGRPFGAAGTHEFISSHLQLSCGHKQLEIQKKGRQRKMCYLYRRRAKFEVLPTTYWLFHFFGILDELL